MPPTIGLCSRMSACGLFAERGYAAAGTIEIVEAAGVGTRGALD